MINVNVLLTGAGFTANFGSPLAKQVYNILLNAQEVQNKEKIRELFFKAENIKNSNYEKIYEQILNSKEIDEESKKTFNDLLWTTFLEKVDFFSKLPQWTNLDAITTKHTYTS